MIPLRSTFTGYLFRSLARFDIIRTSEGFQVAPAQMKNWYQLEVELNQVLCVLAHYQCGYVVSSPPLPSSCGYLRAHKQERFARWQAINSRDWFVVLMAAVEYMARGMDYCRGGKGCWYEILAERGVNQTWLAAFQSSQIFMLGVERVGGFLKTITAPQLEAPHTSFMIKYDIPVWYPGVIRKSKRSEGGRPEHSWLLLHSNFQMLLSWAGVTWTGVNSSCLQRRCRQPHSTHSQILVTPKM